MTQTAEPTTFDPALVQDGPTIEVLMHLYDGLVQWTTANDRTLARVAATIRATRRVTPAAIAWWPAAFSAPRSQPDTPAR